MRSLPALAATLLLALQTLAAQAPPAPAEGAAKAPTAPAPPKAKPRKPAKPQGPDNAAVKPEVAATAKLRSKALKAEKQKAKAHPAGPAVDINSATKEELKQLPGITDAYADKIIARRPYATRTHLISKDVLPYALYQSLKPRLAAKVPNAKP